MKKINLIDLDFTLIGYDSFRKYVLYFMFSDPATFAKYIYWIFQRYSKLISRADLFSKMILEARKRNSYRQRMEEFAELALKNIDPKVLDFIKMHTDKNSLDVLCSASPDDYVKIIASKLNWESLGSYFNEDGEFVHLWGIGKKTGVEKKYPKTEFEYNFAISDNDLELLKSFKKYKLYNKQLFQK